MAIMASSSSLQFSSKSNPFLPSSRKPKHLLIFSTKASDPDTPETTKSTEPETPPPPTTPLLESDSFENRLSQVRLRYKSGTGKKAEIRKSKKSTKSGSNGTNVFLPPVPLKEPVSSNGLKVEMGFSSYTERLNGRLAALGLTALLLVELATGKTVIRYHTPAIVFIQIYFVAAVSAVFVKYEKERISIWPTQSNVVKE
ncbi:hypothetical protein AQUCO_00700157v1 [Aquilegia coerulea]|uniref:Uncharacterized protein n=1 Tax=Aquilegia coerulea TaxID=218851 RepID=A0A2G5EIQ0_AQUCA|nr:hypothetical protein AQUCO_00700157v1 [Aquilegia coerulea]